MQAYFLFYIGNWFAFKFKKTLHYNRVSKKNKNRPMNCLTAWSWVQMITVLVLLNFNNLPGT